MNLIWWHVHSPLVYRRDNSNWFDSLLVQPLQLQTSKSINATFVYIDRVPLLTSVLTQCTSRIVCRIPRGSNDLDGIRLNVIFLLTIGEIRLLCWIFVHTPNKHHWKRKKKIVYFYYLWQISYWKCACNSWLLMNKWQFSSECLRIECVLFPNQQTFFLEYGLGISCEISNR